MIMAFFCYIVGLISGLFVGFIFAAITKHDLSWLIYDKIDDD